MNNYLNTIPVPEYKQPMPFPFNYVRMFFGWTGRYFPGIAARLALQIFMTPMRRPDMTRFATLISDTEINKINIGNKAIVTYKWGRGEPVLLLHGWEGYGLQMRAFLPGLLNAGYSVMGIDFPAHGLATGRQTNLPEILRFFKSHLHGTHFRGIIAHSFGTVVAQNALYKNIISADNLVFLGGPASFDFLLRNFGAIININTTVQKRLVEVLEKRFDMSFHSLSPDRIAQHISQPVLVIHDREDEMVSWQNALALAKMLPNADLRLTSGLKHNPILNNDRVVNAAVTFVQNGALDSEVLPKPKETAREHLYVPEN